MSGQGDNSTGKPGPGSGKGAAGSAGRGNLSAKDATRAKAAAAREKVEKQEKRKVWIIRGALSALVLVMIAGIFGAVLVSMSNKKNTIPVAGGELPPGVTEEDPGWKATSADTPDNILIFEDFQCPACDIMEKTYGNAIKETYVKPGKVNITYYPMSFLDQNLRNTSSAQATNAFGCAIVAGAGEKYRETVFANQPEQEGAGYTTEQLKQFGKDAGISGAAYDAFSACVDKAPYLGWGPTVNNYASTQNVTGTPTIIVNGQQLDKDSYTSQESLFSAIDAKLASN